MIKFLMLQGKTPTEIHREMEPVFEEFCPSYASVKNWCRQFKCGRSHVADLPRSGRPSSECSDENAARVKKIIDQDRKMTIAEISRSAKLNESTVFRILHNRLNMRKVCARWVPRLLTCEQKQTRVDCCGQLLKMCRSKNMLTTMVTVDETWVHHYDPESKISSMQWKTPGSPTHVKPRAQKSARKVMLTVFWDVKGVILKDYLPHGNTVNGQYYADLLTKLRKTVTRKRGIARTQILPLLQDNAPSHKARLVLQTANDLNIEILPPPPYSPDLAPSDFFLFPKLKKQLKGNHFDSDEDVILACDNWFSSKNRLFYSEGLFKVTQRWQKCLNSGGGYIEKE